MTFRTYTVALFAIPALSSALWAPTVDLYVNVFSLSGAVEPAAPPIEQPAHEVKIAEHRQVVPSAGLPADVRSATLSTNNSLDAVQHAGRVYLAYRTADGVESDVSSVLVMSSVDEVHWRYETRVDLGTDLRDPRFLSWGDRLLLYVNQVGTQLYSSEPLRPLALELDRGAWSSPKSLNLPGHRIWRTKLMTQKGSPSDPVPLMTTYVGGDSDARFLGEATDITLLTTSDGYDWRPLLAGSTTVYRGGGSEAAFTSDDDGNLYSVVRNDGGDTSGWGSSVCFAPASDWTDWDCVNDPKKYDSPNLFSYDGEVYLLGRRTLNADGHYDHAFGPPLVRALTNELDYAATQKRCSLWRYIKHERRIAFVRDLPSRGDTCNPAVLGGSQPNQFVIYDYSSDLQGPDLALHSGQKEATFIYRHALNFSRVPPESAASSL